MGGADLHLDICAINRLRRSSLKLGQDFSGPGEDRPLSGFDDDGDTEPVIEFTGSIFGIDGEILAANTWGHFLRIDGIPVRYEGVFMIMGRNCLTPPMLCWDGVWLVTGDGFRMIIKCGQVHSHSRDMSVRFTSGAVGE
jgi:hypothetical protein